MALFHSQTGDAFRDHVTGLFKAGTISFIYVPQAAQTQTFTNYVQAFITNGCTKALALINATDTGIVPYLSVRANLLINGHSQALTQLPQAFREDTSFLERTADHLTPMESFYVQFFRGVLSNRPIILANGLPAHLDPVETRAFLSLATGTLASSQSRLVLFTADHELLEAHPDNSFKSVPTLTGTKNHA